MTLNHFLFKEIGTTTKVTTMASSRNTRACFATGSQSKQRLAVWELFLGLLTIIPIVITQNTPYRTTTYPTTAYRTTLHHTTFRQSTAAHPGLSSNAHLPTQAVTTPRLLTAFPTQPSAVVGNLTGDHICPRPVIETRYVWKYLKFECDRKEAIHCWMCEPNCPHINITHCERTLKGECTAEVYQYEPTTVHVKECCEGYEQKGTTCVESVECKDNNGGCPHICRSHLQAGRHCECFQGFQENGSRCVDFNECSLRNGDCSDRCVNTIGSYYCGCRHGRQLVTPYRCDKINPCTENNGGCDHSCLTSEDGHQYCTCLDGFELKEGRRCLDVDECLKFKPCAYKCENRIGSYICRCPEQQSLQADNKTCIGPDGKSKTPSSGLSAEIFQSPGMIAGLAVLGGLLLLVVCVWIVCCYIRGACCCRETDESTRRRRRQKREDVQAIVVQYSNMNKEESNYNDPPAYDNPSVEEYSTHARNPNGLNGATEMDGDIHIIPDFNRSEYGGSEVSTTSGKSRR